MSWRSLNYLYPSVFTLGFFVLKFWSILMKKRVAVLVDGTFFLKRYFFHFQKSPSDFTPEEMARAIHSYCLKHILNNGAKNNKEQKEKRHYYCNDEELYRIFFYDCKPLKTKAHYPISKKAINFEKSETYIFKTKLFEELMNLPCLALRFGYLDEDNAEWIIRNERKRKKLLNGSLAVTELKDDDYAYVAKQKGVDMRIGLDIASLSLKKLVQKIVLISGDSDFVPAAKLARREGIHFILDPMRNPIRKDLKEHIDWLKTRLPDFKKTTSPIKP